MRIIVEQYSTYADACAGVQFEPFLNVTTGTYQGTAEMNEETAAIFTAREGFRAVDDTEWARLSGAGAEGLPAPPAAPSGRSRKGV